MNQLRQTLMMILAVSILVTSAIAQSYSPPNNPRVEVSLDSGWKFIRQDVVGAENTGFDDSSWTDLNLPHAWNNLDGQDGGNNYYRGIGWYWLHYATDGSHTNRNFFLKFDGAFSVADVYVNGNHLGQHQGGFAAFVFDATPYINVGGDNVIAVKVNNAFNASIPAIDGGFYFFWRIVSRRAFARDRTVANLAVGFWLARNLSQADQCQFQLRQSSSHRHRFQCHRFGTDGDHARHRNRCGDKHGDHFNKCSHIIRNLPFEHRGEHHYRQSAFVEWACRSVFVSSIRRNLRRHESYRCRQPAAGLSLVQR
ncbi:MAG: sugar-binding domain-containing protein [Limisphaerales bacterium]